MTIAISFVCSNCQARIKAPYKMRRKEAACPSCGEVVLIPTAKVPDAEPAFIGPADTLGQKAPPRVGP
jgi:DNA-directed RNA polymerase subunit RPC12/RpoP